MGNSYAGFFPQYKYQCGESFGRTTHKLLTDPSVQKSPRSLLAPLPKQKVNENSAGMRHHVRSYVPDGPGAATNFPGPALEPRPPAPGPGLEDLVMMDTDPMPWHDPEEYVPRPRLPRGYIWRISHHPASEEREWRLPEITPASAQGQTCGPGWLCGASGGRKPPAKIEGVTLPEVEEITDVKHKWLPNLDVPNAIQQKVIPGYTGFIPRLAWFSGMNYNRSVKEAMKEFDKYQTCDTPTGFTFGNSTRKAYEK
ncbi:ciliary microtubule inner protein 2A isoform X2 [Phaenicophaeus curvirostris]|uniref:ciliary microtubule inner protein 2A isoform X2 n=1 Tax=Phaenicophaeus curvirostris TaxID=33595 RepID=UPI0037F0AEEC